MLPFLWSKGQVKKKGSLALLDEYQISTKNKVKNFCAFSSTKPFNQHPKTTLKRLKIKKFGLCLSRVAFIWWAYPLDGGDYIFHQFCPKCARRPWGKGEGGRVVKQKKFGWLFGNTLTSHGKSFIVTFNQWTRGEG